MRSTLTDLLRAHGITQNEVIEAMQQVPRSHFIAEAMLHKANENTALPIGHGQTISQPLMVATMTQLLLTMQHRPKTVLEIGTGCGYQTAILSKLCEQVFTVERIRPLQYAAQKRLQRLDCYNVNYKHGDGWLGWPSKAPFDAIIVTAAAASLPNNLVTQLVDNGRLIIPIGNTHQHLYQIDKVQGQLQQTAITEVLFVPLIEGGVV